MKKHTQTVNTRIISSPSIESLGMRLAMLWLVDVGLSLLLSRWGQCIGMASATKKLLLLSGGLELLMLTNQLRKPASTFIGNNTCCICSESRNFCLDALREENRSYVMAPPVGYVITKLKTLAIIKVQISINYKNALRKLYWLITISFCKLQYEIPMEQS